MITDKYSNELRSFRDGVEEQVARHRDKLNLVDKALGARSSKVFQKAKDLSH